MNDGHLSRIAGLSGARKALLRRWLQDAGKLSRRARLTAAVRAPGDLDLAALRTHLADRVPDYMLPQRIVVLDDLPRTAAGKIDRRALAAACNAAPVPLGEARADAPRSDAEATLLAIWSEVLGFDDLDVHDDFFEVGGDSLLSIRILARAGKAGLSISPDDFFAHPTVAGQAALARRPGPRRARAEAAGPVPLLPIQHWFFEAVTHAPAHWNQSLLFELAEPLDTADITRAFDALIGHHDALRSAFTRDADGAWQARIEPPLSYDLVEEVDVTGLDSESRARRIREHADLANAALALERAPLLRAVHFVGGDGPDRLLIVAHHAIVDAQSWTTLVEDLETLCRQLRDGRRPHLARSGATLRQWAERLAQHAQSDAMAPALRFWAERLAGPFARPLALAGDPAADTEGRRDAVHVTLDGDATAALLARVPAALRVTVYEALLGALGQALAREGDAGALRIELEGHGREALFDDLDPSGTVGWLTSVFPLVLPDVRDAAWSEPGRAAAAAKRALRELPLNGLSHGLALLRDADAGQVATLRAAGRADVLFNYLGRVDEARAEGLLRLEDGRCGRARHPDCPRAFALEINARIESGCLQAEFAFGPARLDRGRVAALAAAFTDAVHAMIAAADAGGAARATPADFPLLGLDQKELDDLSDMLDDMDP